MLQNAKAVISLSGPVNTAGTGRGGKTCRKDQGISEGPGNTTGGIWISSAIRCWEILTHLTFKNDFFLLFWLIWSDRWVSEQLSIHLNIHTRQLLSFSSKLITPLFIFPFSSKHQPAPIPPLFSGTVPTHPPAHKAPQVPMQAWWCFTPPRCHPCQWDNSCQRRMGDEDVC